MIKVLLADDNQLSLEYFTGLIESCKLDFKIVSTAIDGEEAYHDFLKYKPELVITDIHMPCMNGIELASKIKEIEPQTIIIFLSSYEEFEYVRSALNLRVFDYILKHEMTKERLAEKLLSVQKIIDEQQANNRYFYENNLDYLIQEYPERNNMIDKKYYEIFFNQYHLLVVQEEQVLPFIVEKLQLHCSEQPELKVKDVSYTICNQIVAIVKKESRYLFLIKSTKKEISELTYELKLGLEKQFSNNFIIAVLAENASIDVCLQEYFNNLKLIDNLCFYTSTITLYRRNNLDHLNQKANIDLKSIQKCFDSSDYELLLQLVDWSYNQILHYGDYDAFKLLSIELLQFILKFHNKIINYQKNEYFYAYDDNSSIFWLDAMSYIQWIKKKIKLLVQLLKNNNINNYSPGVEMALLYINQNFSNPNLSAEMIAEKVNMNINNLNNAFKKETGDTVWKKLMKVRIQKAKQLLSQNGSKISEVYLQVGFNSLSYFSTVFRKSCGYSPQSYKKKNEIS